MLFPSSSVFIDHKRIMSIQLQIIHIKKDLAKKSPNHKNLLPYVRATYELYCTCLILCATVLEMPSSGRDQSILALTTEALHEFVGIPVIITNHWPLLWPIQILACSISNDDEYQTLMEQYLVYKPLLGPGPSGRAQALFSRVEEVKARPISEREKRLRPVYNDSTFPRGMLLLRQKDGVLSYEF